MSRMYFMRKKKSKLVNDGQISIISNIRLYIYYKLYIRQYFVFMVYLQYDLINQDLKYSSM